MMMTIDFIHVIIGFVIMIVRMVNMKLTYKYRLSEISATQTCGCRTTILVIINYS